MDDGSGIRRTLCESEQVIDGFSDAYARSGQRSDSPISLAEPTLDRELSASPTVAGAWLGSFLPAHPGVLVGRDDEVGRLDAMLTEKRQRLVAVTGPGAVGKTSVAIAAARRATAAYDAGVRWLAAGSVDSAAGFLGAVAAAIGLPCRARWHCSDSSHSVQLDLMICELVETELLLVIAQAEQLPDACAEFSRAVVDRTRGINILLTSRQPLLVAGEVCFPISPLASSPLEADLDRTHSAGSAPAPTDELPNPSTALHHAHFLRDIAERAAEQVTLRGQESGWSTLDRHAVDLRSSLTWFLAHDRRSALRLVAALGRWWQIRGRYTEGRCAVEAALVNSESCPVALRAPVFAGAALLALLQSDYESAQIRAQEALDLYTGLDDSAGVAWSLALLGGIAGERGEYTVAQQLHEQALVLVSRRADARALGTHLNSLTLVAWLRGDVNRAEHLAHRALDANLQQENQPEVA